MTSSLSTALSPARVALGNFDGVHLGHQHVIQHVLHDAAADLPVSQVVGASRESNAGEDSRAYATVVTFDPHPQEFFSGRRKPLLTPVEEKVELLRDLGVEQLVLLPFDAAIARLTPEAFVGEILLRHLNARRISVGQNFHFGRNRSGNVDTLRQLARQHCLPLCVAPLQQLDGDRISSSNVRHALEAGQLDRANRLLGRPYRLRGSVVRGQQLGRTIGFPTANLDVPADKFLPRWGVYATWVELEASGDRPSHWQAGVVNLGCRPTVAGDRPTVEAHLLDWTDDLYHRRLTLHLMSFLRPETRFDGLDALKAQIARDCDSARDRLNDAPPPT